MIQTVFFYAMTAFILFSAYFVVTARNLFHSAMGLIAVLVGVSGLYLLIDAQFLSAVQVTVYIGGIVVLIVFVILLVEDVTQKQFSEGAPWRKGVAGLAAAVLFGFMVYAISSHPFVIDAAAGTPKSANVRQIGQAMLSPAKNGFVLPFEIISLILIAALIGAITVARAGSGHGEEKEPRR